MNTDNNSTEAIDQTRNTSIEHSDRSQNSENTQGEDRNENTLSDDAGKKQGKTPSIKRASLIAATVTAIIAVGVYWYTTIQIPINEATDEFNEAVIELEARNAELDNAILDLQAVLKSGEKPLDPSVADAASAAIGLAQGERREAPDRPGNAEEIKSEAKRIEHMGHYTDEIANLNAAQSELEMSIKQLKQVTSPEESFIIERIEGIETVTGVEAVTEGNDPNGKLGKAGGYTAAIYFSSNQVSPADLYLTGEFTPIVDAGCDGGGAIEVYATVEDAEKRNDYLAGFDGGVFASGSHKILGTCVIRTSNYLKASQQEALEQAIVDNLIRVE